MRTIDADALQGKEVRGTIGDISGDFIPAFEIALAPTIDAAPIRHGRWIDCSNGWMCSECNMDNTYDKPYCPNCGAKMDLEDE